MNYKPLTLNEMHRHLLRDIIRYAKRQMTWFKRNQEIRWVRTQNQALRHARAFLNL